MAYPYFNPYYPQPMPDNLMQMRQMQQPQMQPMQQPMSQPVQQNPIAQSGVQWVSGEQEARGYLIAPNSAVALWDSTAPTVYLKQADASGKPTLKIYDLVERTFQWIQLIMVPLHAVAGLCSAAKRRRACAGLFQPVKHDPLVICGHRAGYHVDHCSLAIFLCGFRDLRNKALQANGLILLPSFSLVCHPFLNGFAQCGGKGGKNTVHVLFLCPFPLSIAFFAFLGKHLLFLLFVAFR